MELPGFRPCLARHRGCSTRHDASPLPARDHEPRQRTSPSGVARRRRLCFLRVVREDSAWRVRTKSCGNVRRQRRGPNHDKDAAHARPPDLARARGASGGEEEGSTRRRKVRCVGGRFDAKEEPLTFTKSLLPGRRASYRGGRVSYADEEPPIAEEESPTRTKSLLPGRGASYPDEVPPTRTRCLLPGRGASHGYEVPPTRTNPFTAIHACAAHGTATSAPRSAPRRSSPRARRSRAISPGRPRTPADRGPRGRWPA
jgi:hypothetical protein